ncbi:MAG TPA: cytochrome c-type biogenesis CcmF C-terminal domain-containing protein, partial [Fimbriimonas sp.]|nr:cytochrome c-type biogenesis CcmF C-terminal domain-containing protein [Fimbriimonas sp.]
KVAGVWSGQQGSFLLWACCSALMGLLALRGTGEYRRWYSLVFAVFLGCLCGILAYETPFGIIPDAIRDGKVFVPPTGQGMTPSLQNYWVVIHPPTIFLGFGTLTILFAYAVSAILTGNLKDWVAYVRPWSMIALSLLGVGLVMGGLWAYETLGWGGFWKWDPVENTSFVPWIFVATFIHGMIVQTTKQRWHGANLWFGALPFLTFTYGTFLTRSGYLTEVSVHSFAEMDKSALKILIGFLILAVGSFITLYAVRGRGLAKAADRVDEQKGVSRESVYGYGMLLLTLFSIVVAIGMSWPVIMAIFGQKAAVIEEPLYHRVLAWFFVPVMILMAVGPFVSWRAMTLRELVGRFLNVFSVSAGITGFSLLWLKTTIALPPGDVVEMPGGLKVNTWIWVSLLLFLCVFVMVSSLWRVAELVKRTKTSLGGFVAHLGLATLLAGLILSRGLERHERTFMRGDETASLMGYTIKNEGFTSDPMSDRENKSKFSLTAANGEKIDARPGMYYFTDGAGEQKAMVWPHIQRFPTHDVYMAVGEPIVFAWKDPEWFKPGETRTIEGVKVTYKKMTMQGEPGTPSANFGADLVVSIADNDGTTHDHKVEPQFSVGEGPKMAAVDRNFFMAMTQMNAADKSVALQLLFSSPVYQIELYNKPLTGLVWLGSGIMLFGGLLSAYARRRRKVLSPEPAAEVEPAVEPERALTPLAT